MGLEGGYTTSASSVCSSNSSQIHHITSPSRVFISSYGVGRRLYTTAVSSVCPLLPPYIRSTQRAISAISHHPSRITHASITPNSKQQSTNNKQNAARNNLSIEKRMPVTALSEEEEMMRTTVHKFSKDRIAPKVREMDEKAYHIKT